uniref:Thioredoxin domain-containing protein n=2 Tax=Hemiselmis andersenii TaxID=464988 RepID=A0A7S1DS56_HEMAN|mmetsp:Transcript_23896/g.58026  ORF Transcript_23896/g.58026 Transcript_23896/m.58026 type:complete len:175 (+) Transcript_23896:20-544(+)
MGSLLPTIALLALSVVPSLAFSPVTPFNPARCGVGAASRISSPASLLGTGVALADSRKRRSGLLLPLMAEKKTFKSMDDMLENSDVPLLIDFYATWCGPCVIMSRELGTLSNDEDLKGKVTIVKIDTEKYPAIASKYMIEALPTCCLFKNGEIVERFEGAMRAEQIKEMLLLKL